MALTLSPQYIAGLLDGEGYIGCTKRINPRSRLGFELNPIVAVQMGKADHVLKAIAAQYGGFFNHIKPRPSHIRAISAVRLTSYRIGPLLRDVLPYLQVKRRHAELLLEFLGFMAGENRHCTNKDLENQVRVFNELKKLNYKGRGKPDFAVFNPRPALKKHIDFDYDVLHKLYIKEERSILSIANMYECSMTLIMNALKKHGIPRRTRGEQSRINTRLGRASPPPHTYILKDPELVRTLYWDEGLSVREVGRRFGVKHPSVLRFMKKHGIPRRSRSAKKQFEEREKQGIPKSSRA